MAKTHRIEIGNQLFLVNFGTGDENATFRHYLFKNGKCKLIESKIIGKGKDFDKHKKYNYLNRIKTWHK